MINLHYVSLYTYYLRPILPMMWWQQIIQNTQAGIILAFFMFFIHGRGIISNVEFNISSRTLAPFRTRQRNDQDHKSDSPNAHGLQIKQNIFEELNHPIKILELCVEVFWVQHETSSFPQFLACCHRCWAGLGLGRLGPIITGSTFSAAAGPQFRGTLKLFTTFLNICTALLSAKQTYNP